MSLLELPRPRRRALPHLIPTGNPMQGTLGALIGLGTSADVTVVTGVTMGATAGGYWIVDMATASSSEEYDPSFVGMILDRDSKPAEAKFTNVIDMLDWLDRD
jgi:hypothetical protein